LATPTRTQFIKGLSLLFLVSLTGILHAQSDSTQEVTDTLRRTLPAWRPTFRLRDRYGDPFSNYQSSSPLFLKDPALLKLELEPDTGRRYNIFERLGRMNYRPPSSMSFSDFSDQQDAVIRKSYWRGKSKSLDGESAVSSRNLLPKLYISPVFDRIFGGSYVELIPRGFVTLDFGGSWQKIENPSIPIRQQRNGGFVFDQQINLSVTGKIGEKMKVTTNFDNNNSFDFQNQMKIEYTGFKEDVLKKLEIGNVSLPLNNSLITGAQNLFGVKAQLQFGKLFVTGIATTQRGKQSTINIAGSTSGAAQGKPFEIVGSNYDDNRHFFLGQFFRDNFENWLSTLPQITSGINITRVEVYLVNRQNDTQTLRNIVCFMDMGESDKIYRNDLLTIKGAKLPTHNAANDLFSKFLYNSDFTLRAELRKADTASNVLQNKYGFVPGTDFERITSVRKLAATEFSVNKELGYITLQRKLQNDEALAVAYEYTYNGQVYKVGELSEDYSSLSDADAIFLKMLRPRKINIKDKSGSIFPTWNLMMKNVYSLNVTQIAKEGFQLRVIYRDDKTGIDNPQLQEGDYARTKQLIQVFGLDRLNPYNDPQPDGNFDFVDKVTINAETGLVIFPQLEPFNEGLRNLFAKETNSATRDFLLQKYVYDTLYHTTKAEAELVATKNKFYLTGSVKSGTGKDIIIQGFNISQGSVKVYAGGMPLQEGRDYTVDYTFGKVTILNEGILNSGKDIQITYEQQDPFAFQTRSLLGTRFDYKLSDDINIGSTFLYYNERPLITRNAVGNEPARNLQYGLDFNIKRNSRFLTKMVDALPFLQTKETSSVTFNAEFAQLLPGTSNVINGSGTSFIDDFENSATPYSLLNPVGWKLAAVPKDIKFDLSSPTGAINDLKAGFKRAKLAWYQIDNLFYRTTSRFKPDYINDEYLQNHYFRPVGPQEIFPYRDLNVGSFYEQVFDLAYYPSERGPFNYNPDLNADGTLKNAKENWAGITTAIRTEVDFDKANVEYLEFWLMDPFINTPRGVIDDGVNTPRPNTKGGKLIFHLGSISEDLMRDGKHAFENGLPADGNLVTGAVTSNEWGYVTSQQYINNAFDNSSSSRQNQDVGLDGINSAGEVTKFNDFLNTVPSAARSVVEADPSADDFKYFLGGEYDQKKAGILERYKNYNNQENNSPILTGTEPFAKSGTTIPDNEDLNQDNTLSDLDEYYTYSLDLKPGQLDVGKKYVVDKIVPFDAKRPTVSEATWYLVRIPIRQFEGTYGDINGFKSIRYVRMILTGFEEPVVLRLASFRAVGNRWRQYAGNLQDSHFGEVLEPNLDDFSISVVNAEENGVGNSVKPPYVPPLRRDRDITSPVQRRLNEQSVQLCVDNLPDGDGRAMYKNVTVDLFNYGKLQMFLHAHGTSLKDDQLTAFVRLGTDFDQNYYEVEIPLKITDPADPRLQNGNSATDAVWPNENYIDLDLNELYGLKAARDREGYPLTQLYPLAGPKILTDGRQRIRIFGRPDLSQVKLMMIGVRNPTSADKKAFKVCIWADELRVSNFDRTAGWAVNSVLNAKLADLGNVSGAFKHITYGYGNVQSKISERARGETTIYDLTANIAVDKMLPRWFGVKIPMFASYEKAVINPNFDPANPDMRISALVKSFNTDAEKQNYINLIRDTQIRRSLNFTNVRKVKIDPKAQSHIYDVENFAVTYAFTEATRRNFNFIENTQRSVKGGLAWQYSSKAKPLEPFKNMKVLKSKYFQLLKDLNINLVPSNITIRGELDRSFNKIVYRNANKDALSQAPNFQKYFVFNRYYNIRWQLTKSLTIDYNAKVNAIIDEPDGDINTQKKQDSIINNLKRLGRMKYFEQTITANYTVPLDKFPVTNWMGLEYRYNVGYSWRAAPKERADTLKLGNVIQNSRDQAFTGKLDFLKLYNKWKFLKEANTPKKPQTALEKAKSAKQDTVKRPPDLFALKGIARLVMSLRNVTGSYNITEGTILPGFIPSPVMVGMGSGFNAPGWDFVLGGQDPNIRYRARDNGWLSTSSKLTTAFSQTKSRDLNVKGTLEPFADMKIMLDVRKTTNNTYQEIFRYDPDNSRFNSLSPSLTGAYKISMLTINTAFRNNDSKNSDVFHTFEKNIDVMKKRFTSVYNQAYEGKSQDVLIPAFIAAYTGKDAQQTSLSPFPNIPLPNWRMDYNGLSKLNIFKSVFQSVTISHAYNSSYSVVNYTNSLEYQNINIGSIRTYNSSLDNYGSQKTEQGLIIPKFVINQVLISEQFSPLVGVNVRTQSKVSVRFEYKTKRDLSLNISNAQITELNSKDWSVEVGMTKSNWKMPFRDKGRTITIKHDITIRLNMSVVNNRTIQRKIDEPNIITNGNINFQLKPNISYVVNEKLNIQFYFDRNVNTPLVTNSYRRATSQFGFKLLFNLSQ